MSNEHTNSLFLHHNMTGTDSSLGSTPERSGRLRDQVYRLIRSDLRTGAFSPGERLIEGDLAERYGVSRTPVREALFQLSRDGLLDDAGRGYATPIDTDDNAAQRREIRRLLDPWLASCAVARGAAAQKRKLARALARERAAHLADQSVAFAEASQLFRDLLEEMCCNTLLIRYLRMLDDQAHAARRNLFRTGANRALQLRYDEAVLQAIERGSPAGAETAVFRYLAAMDAPQPVRLRA